ncbi:hypothetical protein HYY70_01025 [Candidatus Woesearchaeota archaeon]|nr:hypothetical protein [Candidatus Woesearchaeota archaeon]
MTDGLATAIAQKSLYDPHLPLSMAITRIFDLEAMAESHSQNGRHPNNERMREASYWDDIGSGYHIGITIKDGAYYMILRAPNGRRSMTYRYFNGRGTLVNHNTGKGMATMESLPPHIALHTMLIETMRPSITAASEDSQKPM